MMSCGFAGTRLIITCVVLSVLALAPVGLARERSAERREVARRADPAPKDDDAADKLTRPERQWQFIRDATDDGCRARLATTQASFQALPDRERPNAKGCGI